MCKAMVDLESPRTRLIWCWDFSAEPPKVSLECAFESLGANWVHLKDFSISTASKAPLPDDR